MNGNVFGPFLRLANEPGVCSSRRRRLNCDGSGGEGVPRGAEDAAVDPEGCLSPRPGVEKPETNEPRERSNCVPFDCREVSAARFNAADMSL